MSKLIIPIEQYARTAAQLATENPILLDKQLVIESDTGKMKLGNGTTAYNSLPYLLVSGTTSQYVRGDGSLATFPSIPSITGLVPYTGANANVNLGTFDLTADVITGATGSYTSSGNGNTLEVTHSSGSGIALNITKGGNGEGLYINKTSGSGNAATIIGTLNATTLVKSGGTASQFLKADGSIDSNSYLTSVTGTTNRITSTGGTTPVIDIASTYVGQNSITTLGTIGTGVWQGSAIADTYISSAAAWNAKIGGSGTTNYLPKFTASGTVGNSIIFDNGTNVLIGTTTDNGAKLQVNGSGYFAGNLKILDTIGTTNDFIVYETGFNNPSGNKSIIWKDGNLPLGRISLSYSLPYSSMSFGSLFNSGYQTSDILTLRGDGLAYFAGNVGIGTASLITYSGYNSLTIAGNTNGGVLNVRHSSGTGISIFGRSDAGVIAAADGTKPLVFQTADIDRLSITSGGNVLVGTTTDNGAKLQVNGNIYSNNQVIANNYATDPINGNTLSNGTVYAMNGINPSNNYGIGIGALRSSSFDMWFQTGPSNGGGYRWYIGTSEKMTMDKNGNVGIGTTSPSSKLSIVGLPTSSAGLSAGDIWNDSGTLKIV